MTQLQANERGLLWAYRLEGQGRGTALDMSNLSLSAGGHDLVWVHLQCDAPGAHQWLVSQGLDEAVIETLTASETRPRMLTQADGVLLVLRGVNTNPGADLEDMISARIWFTEHLVLTARKRDRRLLSMQDLRQSLDQGNGPSTSGEFVAMLVERLADRIGEVVDAIDEDLTRIETRLSELDVAQVRQDLLASRRQSAAVRRYLAPQRDALDALFRSRALMSDRDAYALREQADRTTRYVEELDLARERTLLLQEELQNRLAEEQNARMYVLSIVAAIFLPLSFLTGVFGMNVAGLPGTQEPQAFLFLTVGMTLLAVGLGFFMRWKRWL